MKGFEIEPEAAICCLLRYIGENPNREGLLETPKRILKSYAEFFSGYKEDPATLLKTFVDGCCDEVVVVKGIELVSFCEHHWLPFTGVAHVGYLPNGKIVGLSKIARLVDCFSRRLQIQERLTTQITSALEEHLGPRGSGCIISATHSCLSCRGAKKTNAMMITSSLTGLFKTDPQTRAEFLGLVRS